MTFTMLINIQMPTSGTPGAWGIWGEWLFLSGSYGALVIVLWDLGSKLIVLGIKGVLPKSKKKKLKKPPLCLIF